MTVSPHPHLLHIHFLSLSHPQNINLNPSLHLLFIPQHNLIPLCNSHPLPVTKMQAKWILLLFSILLVVQNVNGEDESLSSSVKPLVKIVKGKKLCDKGWECKGWSAYCCNHTISDYFQSYQFEDLFSKRNSPVAHAVDFWDYHSFITAAAEYQPHGFGTAGGKLQGMKEVAAFLGHVGSKTSCKLKV